MVKGIVFAFLAFAVFAWGDAVVKAIGEDLDPFEVTFFGYLIPLFLSPMFMAKGDRISDLVRWNRPWLMGLRFVLVATTTPLSVMAFRSLPFAEAFALLFLMPSLVTILSIFVLKEHVRWRRGLAVCAAFIGVLVIVRPGFKEILPGHVAAVAGALTSAAVVIVSRMIGSTEKRFTLVGTIYLSTAIFAGLLMIPGFAWPTPHQWILLVAFAATSLVAQALFTVAAMYAPADRVGAAQYSQILWALAIGAIFFDEWPDALALVGIVIVVGAGLFIFAREQTLKKAKPSVGQGQSTLPGPQQIEDRAALEQI
jgi:S-adenosylmethionine uptake transporter